MAYLSDSDLKDGGCCQGIISDADLENLSDSAINTMAQAAKEIIDNYCGRTFESDIPSLVKIASAQLIAIFLTDMSKTGESVESYSYTNDPNAFSNVLNILKFLPDEIGESVTSKARNINVRIV